MLALLLEIKTMARQEEDTQNTDGPSTGQVKSMATAKKVWGRARLGLHPS